MAYTTIDDPSAYFQATLYTGNGSNGHVVTNTGNSDLQADWIWVKMRSAAYNPVVYDTNRRPSGTPFSGSLYVLALGDNYGAGPQNTGAYGPTAIGSNSVTMNQYDTINKNSETFVSWNWKANGGTTASNTDGNITSTVQANQDAGFSIVTYTGNGLGNKNFGHGLGAQIEMAFVKRLSGTADWCVWNKDLASNKYLQLNGNGPEINGPWDGGSPNATVVTVYGGSLVNGSGDDYVAYCFRSVQGYSKIGKYVGNGANSGPFVYTGFKPAFIMTKRIDSAGGWVISDLKRSGYNGGNKELFANLDSAEDSDSRYDLLSNGFKIKVNYASSNASGGTFIYMAFAENPFTTSTGIPATAR